VRFEIMRLDDTGGTSQPLSGTANGTTVDSTVVDAATVSQIVQQAAASGQRLHIRPCRESFTQPS
jgi:hypothetical protein